MTITGGCLCGGLRYVATAAPDLAGLCFCADCRKASGAGCIGFMGFAAADLLITGAARQFQSMSARGTMAVRNFCPECGGLAFGGTALVDTRHTIYAGSLDDASRFAPTIGIFGRDRPAWVAVPAGLVVYDTMP